LRAFEACSFDFGSADSQSGLATPPVVFAPNCVRLSKTEMRMTGSMSPRAKAALAAMSVAFRVANIARSFDIGQLAFSCGPTSHPT